MKYSSKKISPPAFCPPPSFDSCDTALPQSSPATLLTMSSKKVIRASGSSSSLSAAGAASHNASASGYAQANNRCIQQNHTLFTIRVTESIDSSLFVFLFSTSNAHTILFVVHVSFTRPNIVRTTHRTLFSQLGGARRAPGRQRVRRHQHVRVPRAAAARARVDLVRGRGDHAGLPRTPKIVMVELSPLGREWHASATTTYRLLLTVPRVSDIFLSWSLFNRL
jgi:hypothetical protein